MYFPARVVHWFCTQDLCAHEGWEPHANFAARSLTDSSKSIMFCQLQLILLVGDRQCLDGRAGPPYILNMSRFWRVRFEGEHLLLYVGSSWQEVLYE